MKYILTIILCITVGITSVVLSQSSEDNQETIPLDEIHLKDGNVFKGKITEYVPNQYVEIATTMDVTLKFTMEKIKKLKQGQINIEMIVEKAYNFKDSKVYYFVGLNYLKNRDIRGYSFNIGGIKQFSRLMGIGIEASIDEYERGRAEWFLPISALYRAYLKESNVSPYIQMNAGYGFVNKDEEDGTFRADGGLMLNPKFGLRMNAGDGAIITGHVGIKYQKAYFERGNPENLFQESLTYKRVQFGIEVLF